MNSYQCIKTLRGHNARIWAVAISKENKIFATGGKDYSFKIWSAQHGKSVRDC